MNQNHMKRFLTELFIDSIHRTHTKTYIFIQKLHIQFKNLDNFQKFTCSDACLNPLVDTVICVAGFRGTVNIRNIYHEHAQQSSYIYIYIYVFV